MSHWSPENITNLIIALTGLAAAIGGIITGARAHNKADVAGAKADTMTQLVSANISNGNGNGHNGTEK